MTDQISETIPMGALIELAKTGIAFCAVEGGDVIIVQARRLPRSMALLMAGNMVTMAAQWASVDRVGISDPAQGGGSNVG